MMSLYDTTQYLASVCKSTAGLFQCNRMLCMHINAPYIKSQHECLSAIFPDISACDLKQRPKASRPVLAICAHGCESDIYRIFQKEIKQVSFQGRETLDLS